MGEGLSAAFPAVADQSNTGAFPDTGEVLEQVSRTSLSIGFVQLTLPLSPCYPVLLEEDNDLLTLLHHAGRSRARVSQVSTPMSKLFSDALRQSL